MRLFKRSSDNAEKDSVDTLKANCDVEGLIRFLKDKDGAVRFNAIAALEKVGDARAVEPLILSLKDEDEDVRWEAAVALGCIGDTRTIEPLILTLKDESSKVRLGALRALTKKELSVDPRAAESIILALNDNDIFIREAAVKAIGDFKDAYASRAIESLTKALSDPDQTVSKKAKSALIEMNRLEQVYCKESKEWVETITKLREKNSKERIVITLKAKPLESHLTSKIVKIFALGAISDLNEAAGHVSAHKHISKENPAREGEINIPNLCPICGLYPGTQDEVASKIVKWENAAGMFLGGPILGEESTQIELPYRICRFCFQSSQELGLPTGLILENYFNLRGSEWVIMLSFVSEKFAAEIRDLNKDLLTERTISFSENVNLKEERIIVVGRNIFVLRKFGEKKIGLIPPSVRIVVTDKKVVLINEITIKRTGTELSAEKLRALLFAPDNFTIPLNEIQEAEIKGSAVSSLSGIDLNLKCKQSGIDTRIWLKTAQIKNDAALIASVINKSRANPENPEKWMP